MRSESRRAASAAFGCEETAFEGFGANLKSFRARFRRFWLPGLGPNSSFQMPGARGGRHRSRLRPSEALDPQGTPGPLSRVRERVGVRAANTTFQKPIRDTQAAAIAVSSGGGCGFAGAIDVPTRYGRGYGLGRKRLYTAVSELPPSTHSDRHSTAQRAYLKGANPFLV